MSKKERKEYGEPALALHRDIKKVVDKLAKKERVPCIRVSVVEREVGKDPRTVRFHLKLLEEAEYGKLSEDGKLFCPKKTESKSSK